MRLLLGWTAGDVPVTFWMTLDGSDALAKVLGLLLCIAATRRAATRRLGHRDPTLGT